MLVCQARSCGFKSHFFRMNLIAITCVFLIVVVIFSGFFIVSENTVKLYEITSPMYLEFCESAQPTVTELMQCYQTNLSWYCDSTFIDLSERFNAYAYWDPEYTFFFVFMVVSFSLTSTLFFIAFLLSSKSTSFEKSSPYECGFEPFGSDAHSVFNIQYFVVGILFMLFDLELIYLFTWALFLGTLPVFSFWLVIFFLILLIVGFIYEWKKGALDWV